MTLHTGSEAGVIMCSSSRCCLEERTVERIVAIEDMAVDELTKLAQAEQKPAGSCRGVLIPVRLTKQAGLDETDNQAESI